MRKEMSQMTIKLLQSLLGLYLIIILQNRAEYRLILNRRRRRPSWLKSGIFLKIEQDNCFVIQHIDNKAQFYCRKGGDDLY